MYYWSQSLYHFLLSESFAILSISLLSLSLNPPIAAKFWSAISSTFDTIVRCNCHPFYSSPQSSQLKRPTQRPNPSLQRVDISILINCIRPHIKDGIIPITFPQHLLTYTLQTSLHRRGYFRRWNVFSVLLVLECVLFFFAEEGSTCECS